MDIGIVIDICVVDGGWLLGLSGWSEVLIPGGGREEATLGQVERSTCFCSDPSARFCTAVHRAQPVPVVAFCNVRMVSNSVNVHLCE